MKAIVIDGFGGPETLKLKQVDTPEPGRGEVRVRVRCTAVNRADVIQRLGKYPAPADCPRDIPGLEYAGVVDAIGPGVTGVAEGDRVYGLVGGGGYAEYVITHHRCVCPIPSNLNFEQAAAIPEAFITAYDAMVAQANLKSGEWMLVSAVGSGVGTAATQIANAIGARSIGTSRSKEKLERVKEIGLTEGLVVEGARFAERVMEVTGGSGADVVIELVGGPYVNEDLKCASYSGRIILVGLLAGRKIELDLGRLLARRTFVRGTSLRARPLEEEIAAHKLLTENMNPLFASGKLFPMVDRTFELEAASDAHSHMESNKNTGKILLAVG